jgi:hypothetical protein
MTTNADGVLTEYWDVLQDEATEKRRKADRRT